MKFVEVQMSQLKNIIFQIFGDDNQKITNRRLRVRSLAKKKPRTDLYWE